jgi:maltose-binding protein MalE
VALSVLLIVVTGCENSHQTTSTNTEESPSDQTIPASTSERRLNVIKQAIAYYNNQDKLDVSLVLRNDYMDNVNLCIAYENGARPSDNGCM